MGKAIVYCQECGQSLHESDFEKGKASRTDNRPYCAKCRPVAPPPPTPSKPIPSAPATPRRGISDRVPVVRPPPTTPRPFKPATPRSPALLWLSLLFIAVVGAIGLTLALAGGKTPPPPTPVLVEPTPLPPRPKPAPPTEPADKDVDLLRRLLAGPPSEWKRDEIDAALARRPELEGLRKDYVRGTIGLGLREGLVGHWTFDEPDGARDSSGLGHDGKILGDPVRIRGKLGGALRFRGNGEDGVEISAKNELDILEAKSFSLCAWFNPENVPSGSGKANDAWYGLMTRAGMHVGLCFNRVSRVDMTWWLDKNVAAHAATDVAAPGAWSHVVGVVDVVEGRTRVYLNGKFSAENVWAPRSRAYRLGSPWRIGIAAPKAEEYGWSLKGSIDDVRFYARALAADEIAAIAEGAALPSAPPPGRTPSNEGLILHLRADAGVAAEGARVNTWTDVERKIVTHAEDDERPLLKPEGIVCDGRNDRVVLNALPEHAFRESDSFTLMARVRFETEPRGRWTGLFARGSERVPPWYGIYLDPEGRWVFGSNLNLHGSPAKAGVTTVAAVQIGRRERRLYVDGARVATGPSMDGSGPGDLWIGGVKGKSEYFNGAIQEIKLWRRALAPDELTK